MHGVYGVYAVCFSEESNPLPCGPCARPRLHIATTATSAMPFTLGTDRNISSHVRGEGVGFGVHAKLL